MSRPGFITILDKDSPPMMFNAGDAFHYEKLPGTDGYGAAA